MSHADIADGDRSPGGQITANVNNNEVDLQSDGENSKKVDIILMSQGMIVEEERRP